MINKTPTVTVCSNMGLSGAQIFTQATDKGIEARQAVAFFGSFQMPESDLEKINYNPFHVDFDDNYVSGKGATREIAIQALHLDAKDMADSLWHDFTPPKTINA
jgi:hypothetical protein